jgi:hypothetical protein
MTSLVSTTIVWTGYGTIGGDHGLPDPGTGGYRVSRKVMTAKTRGGCPRWQDSQAAEDVIDVISTEHSAIQTTRRRVA